MIRWDGSAWSREPIDLPAGFPEQLQGDRARRRQHFERVADRPPGGLRRPGIVLFQRTDTTGGPHWVERSLGSSPFANRSVPAAGVSEIHALEGQAQPLTATAAGVWVDGSIVSGGATQSFTLFYDAGQGRVSGSWCDVADGTGNRLCHYGLDARLSTRDGYRSFAWAGDGFGTRVITNPLEPSVATGATNHGTYLSLSGTSFARMPGGGGNFDGTAAFSAPDEGWLEGPVHITRNPDPPRLSANDAWPVAARAPLADVTAAPGAPPGALASSALAVGAGGRAALPPAAAAAGVPARLQRSGREEQPARRRLAGGGARLCGRGLRRDVAVAGGAACGSETRRTDRVRREPDGRRFRPATPTAATRSGATASCSLREELDQEALHPGSPTPT